MFDESAHLSQSIAPATTQDATANAPTNLLPPAASPTPDSAPPETPHTIRPNPTDPDITAQIPLPIFTPSRPQPSTLTPQQLTAIALLTSGKTVGSVATMLNIHRSTLHAWKQRPDFADELQSRRAELRDTIDARLYRILLHATHTAIASLRVKDPEESHRNSVRLLSALRPWMPRIDALLQHNPSRPKPPQRLE
jgi:hypothetical protein